MESQGGHALLEFIPQESLGATTVVHLRRKNGSSLVAFDVYIGRPMYQGGWRLPGSKWANPFRLSDFKNNRAAVLEAYEAHIRNSPELLDMLHELRGKRLGCWCVEKRCLTCGRPRMSCPHLDCHGDVLVKLLEERGRGPKTVSIASSLKGLAVAEPKKVEATAATDADVPDDSPIWTELGLA